MGEVWLGKRVAMGRAAKAVAVKLLRTPDRHSRDSFVKEAKLAMLLRHSTIVQVNDVGESQGTCFMEMEWVDGVDLWHLNEWLRDSHQKLPVGCAAYIIGELLKALAFAHSLEVDGKHETIVHRDVTPHNVLISRSGEVKLTDFGIAFMTSDKTSSKHIKGKSRYMSPEHVRQVREPCIDLYGVGAILHEMLDGRKFRHTAETDNDLWSMAFGGYVPPIPTALPAEIEELRRGLLALDLRDRFPSARAALAVLRRWPGYRDRSEDLEQLVREAADNKEILLSATDRLGGEQNDVDQAEPEQDDAIDEELSETAISSSALPRAIAAAVPPTLPQPRNNHRRLQVGALGLFGLGLTGFLASALIERPVERQANAAPDPAPVIESPLEPPPAEIPAAPKPIETEPAPSEPARTTKSSLAEPPTVDSAPPVDSPPPNETKVSATETPATKAPPKPQPRLKKVPTTTVKLDLKSEYPWAMIQIDSTAYVLDKRSAQSRTISLKPGTYVIAYKTDDEDSWKNLGKHSIPTQERASLSLDKPGKLTIE